MIRRMTIIEATILAIRTPPEQRTEEQWQLFNAWLELRELSNEPNLR